MSEPTHDPLAAVYWRRRVAAAGGIVVVLLLFGWGLSGFFDDEPADPRPLSNEQSRPPSTLPRHFAPSRTSATTTTPATSATSAPTVSPTPSRVRAAPVPGPPGPCPDAALAVSVEVGAPEYRVGQRPQFRLVVANAGPVACVRDMNRQFRELVVTMPDGARVWSSQDCYASQAAELRTFSPGTRKTFPVTWSGRISAPGCPSGRQVMGAGTYVLVGRFGPFVGTPVTFTMK